MLGLWPQGFRGAIHQRLLFGVGEFGVGVHRKIVPGWHVALSYLLGDMLGVTLGAIPFGEVQMAAGAVDVVLDQPGYGRDVGIPGPDGRVAVTIEAGAME